MTIKITKADLTKALSVPWAGNTCLVAQAITRATGNHVTSLSRTFGSFDHNKHFKVTGGSEAQREFDEYHFVRLIGAPEGKLDTDRLKKVKKFIGTQFELTELKD